MIYTQIPLPDCTRKTAEEVDAATARTQAARQSDYQRAQRGPQPNPDADSRTAPQKWLDSVMGFSYTPPTYTGWLEK